MELEEFIATLEAECRKGLPFRNGQREGQWWFNRAHTYRPELCRRLAGTFSDPFYKNSNLDRFILVLIEEW